MKIKLISELRQCPQIIDLLNNAEKNIGIALLNRDYKTAITFIHSLENKSQYPEAIDIITKNVVPQNEDSIKEVLYVMIAEKQFNGCTLLSLMYMHTPHIYKKFVQIITNGLFVIDYTFTKQHANFSEFHAHTLLPQSKSFNHLMRYYPAELFVFIMEAFTTLKHSQKDEMKIVSMFDAIFSSKQMNQENKDYLRKNHPLISGSIVEKSPKLLAWSLKEGFAIDQANGKAEDLMTLAKLSDHPSMAHILLTQTMSSKYYKDGPQSTLAEKWYKNSWQADEEKEQPHIVSLHDALSKFILEAEELMNDLVEKDTTEMAPDFESTAMKHVIAFINLGSRLDKNLLADELFDKVTQLMQCQDLLKEENLNASKQAINKKDLDENFKSILNKIDQQCSPDQRAEFSGIFEKFDQKYGLMKHMAYREKHPVWDIKEKLGSILLRRIKINLDLSDSIARQTPYAHTLSFENKQVQLLIECISDYHSVFPDFKIGNRLMADNNLFEQLLADGNHIKSLLNNGVIKITEDVFHDVVSNKHMTTAYYLHTQFTDVMQISDVTAFIDSHLCNKLVSEIIDHSYQHIDMAQVDPDLKNALIQSSIKRRHLGIFKKILSILNTGDTHLLDTALLDDALKMQATAIANELASRNIKPSTLTVNNPLGFAMKVIENNYLALMNCFVKQLDPQTDSDLLKEILLHACLYNRLPIIKIIAAKDQPDVRSVYEPMLEYLVPTSIRGHAIETYIFLLKECNTNAYQLDHNTVIESLIESKNAKMLSIYLELFAGSLNANARELFSNNYMSHFYRHRSNKTDQSIWRSLHTSNSFEKISDVPDEILTKYFYSDAPESNMKVGPSMFDYKENTHCNVDKSVSHTSLVSKKN